MYLSDLAIQIFIFFLPTLNSMKDKLVIRELGWKHRLLDFTVKPTAAKCQVHARTVASFTTGYRVFNIIRRFRTNEFCNTDLPSRINTYMVLLGRDACERLVSDLTETAIKSIRSAFDDTGFLEMLAGNLAKRRT